jgi:hypothetical protein
MNSFRRRNRQKRPFPPDGKGIAGLQQCGPRTAWMAMSEPWTLKSS